MRKNITQPERTNYSDGIINNMQGQEVSKGKKPIKKRTKKKKTAKPKRKKVEFWATIKAPKKVKVSFYARKKKPKGKKATKAAKTARKKTTRKKTSRKKQLVIDMVSAYHRNVEGGILAFGRKYKRFAEINGSNVPIHINHPTKRMLPILYHPDAHFVTKFGKRYIFEILDSELKNENLIIADILLACLSPNTSKVIFIVPKDEDQIKVYDLIFPIMDNLVNNGVPKRKLPRVVATLYILRSEAKTSESVTEILVNSAKDRGVTI